MSRTQLTHHTVDEENHNLSEKKTTDANTVMNLDKDFKAAS